MTEAVARAAGVGAEEVRRALMLGGSLPAVAETALSAAARATVDLPIPSCRATCRCGTPSATSRRINAQSSTEITQPICLSGLIFERRYGLVFERCRQRSCSAKACVAGPVLAGHAGTWLPARRVLLCSGHGSIRCDPAVRSPRQTRR